MWYNMPSTRCAVDGCQHYSMSTTGISYHLLPVDANRKKLWEEATGRSLPPYARVCSAHFCASDYLPLSKHYKRRRLKRTAVPSLFVRTRKRTVRGRLPSPGVPFTFVCTDGLTFHRDVFVGSIATAEVGAYAEVSTTSCATEASELSEPHEEHAYASRLFAPRFVPASTQANLLVSPEKRDFATQTELLVWQRR
ncbi:uncharacterized protein LOC142563880 isoform X2 [Dermacentor variabilis]|uniref:uncharacterized protein LOC142563880 isoform X2 n=1 Tax=Dermacentor variabilis TaxID=34621 RepID=UPI003F5B3783